MMLRSYLNIVFANIKYKLFRSVFAALIIAAALALSLSVLMTSNGVRNGLIAAVEPFDMIMAAKGSPNQLVLNTVFLQDSPIGNIDNSFFDEMSSNPLVAEVIPMGFGDNYKGLSVIGTTAELFTHGIKKGGSPWLSFSEGAPFLLKTDAVIGADTAILTGLKVGDVFKTSHGNIEGYDEHTETNFKVVGILNKLNAPYDKSVIVPINALWGMHNHEDEANVGNEEKQETGDYTALLIKPQGYAEALKLYSEYINNKNVQLVFPSQVVSKLFVLIGDGSKLLKTIGYIVFAASVIILTFLLYWSSLERRRDNALLRVAGAKRRDILLVVFIEGLVVSGVGVLAGTLSAFGLTYYIGRLLEGKTYVYMTGIFTINEFLMIVCLFCVCVSVCLIPAFLTMRNSVAKDLR